METTEKIVSLIARGVEAELLGMDFVQSLDLETVRDGYNGIGPEFLDSDTRAKVTDRLAIFEPAALVHDLRNEFSDGTRYSFNFANYEFLQNCRKLADLKYGWYNPHRYVARHVAHLLYAAVSAEKFGWRAWLEAKERHEKKMRALKKLMLTVCLAAFSSFGARAELVSVGLEAGDNAVPAPCRAVMIHAISTNESGTVTLKKVSSYSLAWTDWQTVTNITYGTAWSNLTHTVTNDVVTAWRTNLVDTIVSTNGVTNLVVATNFLARAVNQVPSVFPWPDLLILTNKVASSVVYTNIPYRIESSRRIEKVGIPKRAEKSVTNDLASVTLSSGFKTNTVNCLFAPGDWITASGTVFSGGRVQLIIEK